MTEDRILHRMSELLAQPNLTSTDAAPKYQRVGNAIRMLVDRKELKPGDRLPRESDMAAHLPVSLGTIRNALNSLSSEGRLSREQGRGTFVTEAGTRLFDLWHFRFVDTNGDEIVPVYTHVLSLDRVGDRGPWSVFLGKDKFYVRISRLIDIGHETNAIGQFYLRGDRYAELLHEDPRSFEGVHLRDVVMDRYGAPTLGVEVRVSSERLPDAVCQWLDLPFFSIGLVCQILGHSYRKAPLSFQHVFVPANARPLQIRETHPNR